MLNDIRTLVTGCGSIGRRHIENLLSLGVERVVVFDPNDAMLEKAAADYPVEPYRDLDEVLATGVELTFICAPNCYHSSVALSAAEVGSHLFIEKPLCDDLNEEVERLAQTIERQGLVCLVGCNMRFHPALERIKKTVDRGEIGTPLFMRSHFGHYLPNWRPGQDYRKSYSAQLSLGGGVTLDGIHEIDFAVYLMGEVASVFSQAGHVSELEIDVEDSADLFLRFNTEKAAAIHLDYLDRTKRRSCEVIGTHGTITWMSVGKKPEKAIVELFGDNHSLWREEFDVDPNEAYIAEIKHLLQCVRGFERPTLDIRGGIHDVAIALAAIKSQASAKRETVMPLFEGNNE